MKRTVCFLVTLCLIFTAVPSFAANDEMRGVWFSYEDYAANLSNLSAEEFDTAAEEICKNIKSAGCNALIFHVRAFSDAFYNSSYFTFSKYAMGEAGKAPGYDPLAKMCEIAHKNGLELHAWINPYRIGSPSNVTADSVAYAWRNTYGDERVCSVNGLWYYNPASAEVRDYIIEGVTEIVSNYSIDGIHFDDYFYPTTDPAFDDAAYIASGTNLPPDQWRIENINLLIKKTYDSIKEIKPDVLFGISPDANIEKNYSNHYADVKKWMSEPGYVDYIAPQIYFGYDNSTMPFGKVLKEWSDLCTASDLYIGLAAYKSGKEDKWAGEGSNEWINNSDICARQIKDLRAYENIDGFMLFCYSPLWGANATNNAKTEIENITSLITDVNNVHGKTETEQNSIMEVFIKMIKALFNF